ncbi:CLUMA_CG006000, isoform A [Clunio marinus]|uniref:CLUMA_CG006000, isoform A n=1 Tax=Clunio marinus TaxID=568069 RepID=A0A1J1I234_9DIPT|nr:CLUMA_CG006000, isoform A [Clunio marinus]
MLWGEITTLENTFSPSLFLASNVLHDNANLIAGFITGLRLFYLHKRIICPTFMFTLQEYYVAFFSY